MSLGIDFVLRANSAAFTKGLAQASNAVKDIKKSLREADVGREGKFLKEAFGVGGVIAGFKLAIDNARELRDEADKIGKSIDDGTRSVAEFGDAIGSITTGFKNALTTGLSFFTGLGDEVRRSLQGVTKDQEDAARNMELKTRKAMEEQIKATAKSREDNSPEKQAAAQEKLNKARREGQYQGTEAEKKLLAAINDRFVLEDKLKKLGPETVAFKETEAELEKNSLEKKEALAGIEKEAADEKKKRAEEQKKVDDGKRKLAESFGPSVEQLAGTELGGFFDGNDPRLKARKVLETEAQAKDAFGRMDFKGGMELAGKAQGLRSSLEDQMAGVKPTAAKEPPTAAQMDDLIKAVQGIIKATP